LPLNSLARVTNLSNGRSVIVTVNDRGPVSRDLIIDMSPNAAEQLDMKRSGIVPVSVEPVSEQSASLH
jgi:rare lipoprotein A